MSKLWDAYLRWRAAAGALGEFVLPSPFLAPWTPVRRRPAHQRAAGLLEAIAARANEPGTAVFLEAPPRLGLAVSTGLLTRGWRVAPMYSRWPVKEAVLPVEALTSWLLAAAPTALRRTAEVPPTPPPPAGGRCRIPLLAVAGAASSRPQRGRVREGETSAFPAQHTAPFSTITMPSEGAGGAGLAILLDSERNRRVSAATLRRRFDNRYEYPAMMLPPAERWRAWGVRRVLWLGPTAAVPADMAPYADSLTTAGIVLDLVRA